MSPPRDLCLTVSFVKFGEVGASGYPKAEGWWFVVEQGGHRHSGVCTSFTAAVLEGEAAAMRTMERA